MKKANHQETRYAAKFKPRFLSHLKRYAGMKAQIRKKVLAILVDPYHNTEPLEKRPKCDLRGIRSKRIDRNFRITFAICEECRRLFPERHDQRGCRSCDPKFDGRTVIFFAVQPHEAAYDEIKPLG